jgi:hypothetical protein
MLNNIGLSGLWLILFVFIALIVLMVRRGRKARPNERIATALEEIARTSSEADAARAALEQASRDDVSKAARKTAS